MHDIKTFEGTLNNVGGRYALVVARFNSFVVEALLAGAVDTLVRHGVARDDIEIIRVPGAWELPVAVKKILEKRDYDAVIALGAVIRGGTAHFEYVAGEAAKGIAAVQNDTGVPVRLVADPDGGGGVELIEFDHAEKKARIRRLTYGDDVRREVPFGD